MGQKTGPATVWIVGIAILAAGGCVPTDPVEHARNWMQLSGIPFWQAVTYVDDQRVRSLPWKMTRIGTFTAAATESKAVLYDREGRAIWAGQEVLPLRRNERDVGMLLTRGPLWGAAGTSLFSEGGLDCQKIISVNVPEGDLQSFDFGLLLDVSAKGPTRYVLDIDGDGCDEAVMATTNETQLDTPAGARCEWYLRVFSTSSRGVRPRLVSDTLAAESRPVSAEPTDASEWSQALLTEVLSVPLPEGMCPRDMDLERTGDGRGLSVTHAPPLSNGETRGRRVALGVIRLDKRRGQWVLETGHIEMFGDLKSIEPVGVIVPVAPGRPETCPARH